MRTLFVLSFMLLSGCETMTPGERFWTGVGTAFIVGSIAVSVNHGSANDNRAHDVSVGSPTCATKSCQ